MSQSSNPSGEIFEDFISLNNLFVCNIGNKYTYDCAFGKSIIDITLVTNLMVDRIKDWVFHDEDFLSDHKLITFNFNINKGQPLVSRNIKNADWSYFKNFLAKKKWENPPSTWSKRTIVVAFCRFSFFLCMICFVKPKIHV